MTYEEFAAEWNRIMRESGADQVPVTPGGMDKSTEDFIFSPGYITGDMPDLPEI
jgi:hypothetical protein